ncbi:MAG: efflux RND transporter periplasmic adaptor subunit [Pseudomonadota bacterium]
MTSATSPRGATATVRVLSALAIALATTSLPAHAQDEETSAAQAGPRPVKLMTVSNPGDAIARRFFGQIAARETVDLAFQVGGKIERFPIIEGGLVERGNLVAQLDLDDFELAMERAEVALEQASRDLERTQALADSRTVSEVAVLDRRTAYDLAEVTLKEARDAWEEATLVAPFDALVAERIVANFTTVSPGQPVARLHDMSEVRVEVDMPEQLFAAVPDVARLRFDTVLRPGSDPIPLRLTEYQAQAETIGQTYRVTLVFPEMPNGNLLPGASATVQVSVAPDDDEALAVPATAVLLQPDRSAAVLVYQGDETGGTVVRRAVSVASETGTEIRVRGDIAPGDRIVAAGGHRLQDGQRVRPFTGLRAFD